MNVARDRGEFSPLFDCFMYGYGPGVDPYCSVTFSNGTRAPTAFVCTVVYRDDQSGDPDFRWGDPEPDTGTFTFRTPVIPARYAMDVTVRLPFGKLPSVERSEEIDCSFAKF
ncbi:hypothetical protein ABZ766_33485 [Streptomyces sp. NPDC006670]|uniref:hypothetical protein n=1 Tax=Streptomyces sp. NPDC006670 TaxID=3154476 RepID=UPI0033DEC01D